MVLDNAKQTRGCFLYRDTVPRFVGLLLPEIKGLTVNLVDSCLGNGHRVRIAGQEKIHVINISVGARHIHACEMAARPQVCEIFGVDPNKLKLKLLVSEVKPEISSTQACLLFDVFFDTFLYVRCYYGRCRA